MAKYVNFDQLIDFLRSVRANRDVNISPYMDSALLNIQQMLEVDIHNPLIFDYVEIGNCEGCKWKNRYQKCSCCRRNRHMKDSYEGNRK